LPASFSSFELHKTWALYGFIASSRGMMPPSRVV
jgi:hypothetical protein